MPFPGSGLIFETTAEVNRVNAHYERWREAVQALLPDSVPTFDQEQIAQYVQQAQQRLSADMQNALYGDNTRTNALQQAAHANHLPPNLGNQLAQYGQQIGLGSQRQPLPDLRSALRTTPYRNSYEWPAYDPNYRYVQAYIHYRAVEFALQIVTPEAFYQTNGAVAGRPAYVCVHDQELLLYPSPDAEYDIFLILQDRAYQHGPGLVQQAAGWANYGTIWSDPAAEKKALHLLKEWLTPTQLNDFEQYQHFYVRGSKTHTRYKITSGTTFNVVELDAKGEGKTKLCFQPVGASTIGDTMLAQKIMLETDEPRALKIANRSSIGIATGGTLYNELAAVTRRAFRGF
jgi:hypothetical protein